MNDFHSSNACSGNIYCENILWVTESSYTVLSNVASLARSETRFFFLNDDITHSIDDCEHFCQIHVRLYFMAGFKAECARLL